MKRIGSGSIMNLLVCDNNNDNKNKVLFVRHENGNRKNAFGVLGWHSVSFDIIMMHMGRQAG